MCTCAVSEIVSADLTNLSMFITIYSVNKHTGIG